MTAQTPKQPELEKAIAIIGGRMMQFRDQGIDPFSTEAAELLGQSVAQVHANYEQSIATRKSRAEERMGRAIVARMRQANYQWEKVESFIHSYDLQKRYDPHHIFSQLEAEAKQ